jgi:hypothetical protein
MQHRYSGRGDGGGGRRGRFDDKNQTSPSHQKVHVLTIITGRHAYDLCEELLPWYRQQASAGRTRYVGSGSESGRRRIARLRWAGVLLRRASTVDFDPSETGPVGSRHTIRKREGRCRMEGIQERWEDHSLSHRHGDSDVGCCCWPKVLRSGSRDRRRNCQMGWPSQRPVYPTSE